jgi:PTH2 family peptidyl-tRNA hydrolase
MSIYKQVIVMRKFPSLRKGKYIAQGCHASLEAATQASKKHLLEWALSGNTKIVVYVESELELRRLRHDCEYAKIPCYLVEDAGRTEFPEPTITALGIGPASSEEIDKITGHLPLF